MEEFTKTSEMQNSFGEQFVLTPGYYSSLTQASHHLHIALDRMSRTPCAKKEDFEELVGIYSDLGDFMDRIWKESAEK